jgi:acyl carrier protein
MKEEIVNRVRTVMSEVFKCDVSEHENLVRSQTEQWDSLKHLELILALEDEFKIRFSAEQAANMDSLEDIVNILGGNG